MFILGQLKNMYFRMKSIFPMVKELNSPFKTGSTKFLHCRMTSNTQMSGAMVSPILYQSTYRGYSKSKLNIINQPAHMRRFLNCDHLSETQCLPQGKFNHLQMSKPPYFILTLLTTSENESGAKSSKTGPSDCCSCQPYSNEEMNWI